MYAKVFASLFEGSMRGKSDLILVFVNMLSHADQDGTVDRHWRAISDETGLSIDRVKAAILELESPDPESRSEAEEGRRIIRLSDARDWGWSITNHRHYRDIVTESDRRNYMREYMKQKRASNVNSLLTNVNTLSVSVSESVSSPRGIEKGEYPADFLEFWKAYPKKVGKDDALKKWKSKTNKPPLDVILMALEKAKASHQWKKEGGQFIPHPSTWLNQGRWADVPMEKVDTRINQI